MLPYPLGPITDDAQAHLLFRNQAGLFDLLEGLAELRLVLHLVPTEHMDDPIPIHQIKAKAFRLTPLAPPQRSLGPMAALAGTAPPGTLRARGHLGPINARSEEHTSELQSQS